MSEKLTTLWECVLSIWQWVTNIVPFIPDIMNFLTLVVAWYALSTWKKQKKSEAASEAAWDLYVHCKAYSEFLRRSAKGHVLNLELSGGELRRVMPNGISKYAEKELAAYMTGQNELRKKCTDQIDFFKMRVGDQDVEGAASNLMNLEAQKQLFTALTVVSKTAKASTEFFNAEVKALKKFVEAGAMEKPAKDALRELEQAVIGYIRYDNAGRQK